MIAHGELRTSISFHCFSPSPCFWRIWIIRRWNRGFSVVFPGFAGFSDPFAPRGLIGWDRFRFRARPRRGPFFRELLGVHVFPNFAAKLHRFLFEARHSDLHPQFRGLDFFQRIDLRWSIADQFAETYAARITGSSKNPARQRVHSRSLPPGMLRRSADKTASP